MKKGFTLIEMLGIITVLAILMLITFPNLSNSLKKTKEQKNNNFTNNLKVSAEAYIELNRKNYPELDKSRSVTITIQDLYDANLLKGNFEVNTSNKIIIIKNEDETLDYYYVDPNETEEYNFTYTGGEQEYNTPQDGLYQIETWGAQGGQTPKSVAGVNTSGGYGGYSKGNIYINAQSILYINVGGTEQKNCEGSPTGTCYGGYNGGGNSYYRSDEKWGAGGGATHIATKSGLLSALSSENDIPKILIVSGGGGGAYAFNVQCGSAGGYKGVDGCLRTGFTQATGGTQTNGGSGSFSGTFGMGGNCNGSNCSGGGAGFYGGGGTNATSGAGGSSYIGNPLLTGKSMYCYGCEESNEPSTFTVSTTGDSELKDTTNCPDGYSEDPIAKCAKAGNGYAKITYLGKSI